MTAIQPSVGQRGGGVVAQVCRWLVVLDRGSSQAAVDALRAVGQVLSVTPPRLAVVEASDPAPLRAVSGVVAVRDSVDESLLGMLTFEEGVAARAFAYPRSSADARPGDGLAWDAPGFEPPDDPAARGAAVPNPGGES
jgi:hypothetical protein